MGTANFDFTDEVAVVTGGSSGIGRATAIEFGAAGATAVVADVRRDPKDLNADAPTDEVIADAGGQAHYVETDVSDAAEVESVVEAAREFGGVDVMVNNAGLFRGGSITDLSHRLLADCLIASLSEPVRGRGHRLGISRSRSIGSTRQAADPTTALNRSVRRNYVSAS